MSDTDNLTDTEVFARTLWAEARGEGMYGMQAVASVVLNRIASGVTWWGQDIRSICLKPWQFSCWNRNDPNRAKMLDVTEKDGGYIPALAVAKSAIRGGLPDQVSRCDSYHDIRMEQRPHWAKAIEPMVIIGHHAFYRTVRWLAPTA